MSSYKVVHVPYSKRNPYQKLLGDSLETVGVAIKGAQNRYLRFLDITILNILVNYWKPDIIHLHWQHSFLLVPKSRIKTIIKSLVFIFELLLTKTIGIKIVWTVHNLKKHEDIHRDLEKRFTRILARLTDVIIAHCKTAKSEICRELDIRERDKVVVIPHGTYLDYYPNTVSQEEARKQLNFSPSDMTYLFLGEVRYYKGVLELIDTFQKLEAANAKLIIAGKPHDTEIAAEVLQRANNNRKIITTLKFISNDELQIYINASDIMIFPYQDILTSGGIVLAMSFGKPIIAPRLGCIEETSDTDGSFLYATNHKDGLLNAMRKAMASRLELQRMGNHNLELVRNLGWNTIGELTYQVYERSLQNTIE